MKILRMDRRKGKTTQLIIKSSKEGKRIICASKNRANYLNDYAYELGILIPKATYIRDIVDNDCLYRSDGITFKGVLIDDVEDVLSYLLGFKVDTVTTSSEIIIK